MKNNLIQETEVSYNKGRKSIKGIFTLDENYLSFSPFNKEFDKIKEAVYRIVQTGFRKKLQFIPYKFYIKTMSGRVIYFSSLKARKIVKSIEDLIY